MKLLLDLSHDYLKCGANEVNTKLRPRIQVLVKAWKWGKETTIHFVVLLPARRGGENLLHFSYF